ncbi:MAG: hypothetical protein A2847_02070 [Candidatus Sungbacteria bacterium RIFCSPHIGHO2_01_FULL_50_25]|uniref:Uncharacterized protein n=1 Tax=Candidatus Sungbacteria bacterium RIFCSPHIGHO2_01_FULL_50_25 TaxID=1802265 RepID=A0A1G2K690_9BACT|nr:MAG: hypothetical protein A2847_02070 [Candidatus Sungbacteria bacterium RIFCSPHIGHO2_01_FULL_50_25]
MATAPTRIVFDLGDKIRVSPPIWPDHKLDIQPGDLSKSVPYGNGVYGYQDRKGSNPFTSAPSQEACGGVIYFSNGVSKDDFEAFMRILEVQPGYVVKPSKDFAVFTAESKQPGKDGYLVQMRVVSKFGLRFMFGALTDAEYEKFPEQELTIVEALWSFIKQERKRWGTSWMDDKGLGGKFGGDGDFACEELAFGFMLENDYHRVYRIWSRAWLVTK